MKNRELATLSIKILSLYTFVHAVDKLPDVIYFLFETKKPFEGVNLFNFILISMPLVLLLIMCVVLWYKSQKIASIIFNQDYVVDRYVSIADFQVIAFSIVGLVVIAKSIPDFVSLVIFFFVIFNDSYQGNPQIMSQIIVFLIQILMGCWLLLGAHEIAIFVRKLNGFRK